MTGRPLSQMRHTVTWAQGEVVSRSTWMGGSHEKPRRRALKRWSQHLAFISVKTLKDFLGSAAVFLSCCCSKWQSLVKKKKKDCLHLLPISYPNFTYTANLVETQGHILQRGPFMWIFGLCLQNTRQTFAPAFYIFCVCPTVNRSRWRRRRRQLIETRFDRLWCRSGTNLLWQIKTVHLAENTLWSRDHVSHNTTAAFDLFSCEGCTVCRGLLVPRLTAEEILHFAL